MQLYTLKINNTTRSQRRRSLLSEQQATQARQQDRAAARALLSEQQRDRIRQQSSERQRAARQRESDLRRSGGLAANRMRETQRHVGESVEQR